MGQYKVYPKHNIHGYAAPTLTVEAEKESSAGSEARKLSGLGRFDCWNFSTEDPNGKGKRSNLHIQSVNRR